MARTRVVVLSVLALLLVVVLAACSSSPATGSLKVTVSGLPAGVNGAVTVTGPGGYSTTVTATTTLPNLSLGTYSVVIAAVPVANAIVPVMYDGSASSSSVTVTENTTASTTVSYATRAGSGYLWVPMMGGGTLAVEGFASTTLAATGSTGPDVSIAGPNGGEAVAFDGAGNMWVSQYGGTVLRFGASQLASSGPQTPSRSIDASSYGNLSGLAFDAAGNLWVAVGNGNELLEYTPAQLAAGGTLTPPVVIGASAGGSLQTPIGIAFDATGALWVANLDAPSLVEYSKSQLASTGNPTPAVTITNGLSRPYGIAIDGSGNLWVADSVSGVLRYDHADLGSPSASPAATILGTSTPEALAFDASGALWVFEYGSATLGQFTNPGALTGTVSPAANVAVSSIGSTDVAMLAFSPSSSTLPIQAP